MNNVLCILIDSVIWESIGRQRTKVSTTPFIDTLKGESLVANKLFSYGPYTNSATRSLYTGRPALDDFGYYFQLNTAPTNHYKAFHDAGYETYGFYYPYYIIGEGIKQYVDHTTYLAGFIFTSEWGGIYRHYTEIQKTRELNETEFALLIKRTTLMFDVWIDFYNDLIEHPETGELIREIVSDFDVKGALEILKNEFNSFKESPKDYLLNLLDQGEKHILANLDNIDVDKLIDRSYLNERIYGKFKSFFKLIDKNNKKANKSLRPGIKRFFKGIRRRVKTKDAHELDFLINYLGLRYAVDKLKKDSQTHWQDIPSARVQLDYAASVLEKRGRERPFFMSLHFLEPHNRVSFFTFDVQDETVHDEEFNMLTSYAKDLGSDFKGSITYYLSVRYVDYCIERFCTRLKELNLWNNTTLLLVADHGSSYSFCPLHNTKVNCFDEECYHVPMYIRHPGMIGREIDGYYNSKDILPTLFDVLGLSKPDGMTGVSMIDDNSPCKDYVLTEYMGPGCPDMSSKYIWYSARDAHFMVAYKVRALESFDHGFICEAYDLEKDPEALYNIADTIKTEKIQYLLDHIKERHTHVKKQTEIFLQDIK